MGSLVLGQPADQQAESHSSGENLSILGSCPVASLYLPLTQSENQGNQRDV